MLPYKAFFDQLLDNTLTDLGTHIFFKHVAHFIVLIQFFYLSQSWFLFNLQLYIYFLLLSLRFTQKISILLFERYIAHNQRCTLIRTLWTSQHLRKLRRKPFFPFYLFIQIIRILRMIILSLPIWCHMGVSFGLTKQIFVFFISGKWYVLIWKFNEAVDGFGVGVKEMSFKFEGGLFELLLGWGDLIRWCCLLAHLRVVYN